MCNSNEGTCCCCIPIKLGIFLIALCSLITSGSIVYYGILRNDPIPQNPITSPDFATFLYHLLRVIIIVIAGIFFFCGLVLPIPIYFCTSCFILISNILSTAVQASFFVVSVVILACLFSDRCVVKTDDLFNIAIATIVGIVLWEYFINVLYNYSCNFKGGRGCCNRPCFPWDLSTCCSPLWPSQQIYETPCRTNCLVSNCTIPNNTIPQSRIPKCKEDTYVITDKDVKKQAKLQKCEEFNEPCGKLSRRNSDIFRISSRPSYSSLGSCSSLNIVLVPSTSDRSTSSTSFESEICSDTDQEYFDSKSNHKNKNKKKTSKRKCKSYCTCKTKNSRNKKYLNYQISNKKTKGTPDKNITYVFSSLEKLSLSNKIKNMPLHCKVPKTKNPRLLCNSSVESESSIVERNDIPESDSKNMSKVYSVRFKCKQARDLLARKFFQGNRKQEAAENLENSTIQTLSPSDSVSDAKCRPVEVAKQLNCTAGTESDEDPFHHQDGHSSSESDDEMTTEHCNKRDRQSYHSEDYRKPLSRDASTDSHDLGVYPPERNIDQSSFSSANDSNYQRNSEESKNQMKPRRNSKESQNQMKPRHNSEESQNQMKPGRNSKENQNQMNPRQTGKINHVSQNKIDRYWCDSKGEGQQSQDSISKIEYTQKCNKNKIKVKRKVESTSEVSNNSKSSDSSKTTRPDAERVTQKPVRDSIEKVKIATDNRRPASATPRVSLKQEPQKPTRELSNKQKERPTERDPFVNERDPFVNERDPFVNELDPFVNERERVTQKPVDDCNIREQYCNDGSEHSTPKSYTLESENSEDDTDCNMINKKLKCKPKKINRKKKDKCEKYKKCKESYSPRINSQESQSNTSSSSSTGSIDMGTQRRLSRDSSKFKHDVHKKNKHIKNKCPKYLEGPDGYEDHMAKKHQEKKHPKNPDDSCIEITIPQNDPVNSGKNTNSLSGKKTTAKPNIKTLVGSSSNESLPKRKRSFRKYIQENEGFCCADNAIFDRRSSRARPQKRHDGHRTKQSMQDSARASTRNYEDSP